MTQKSDEKRKAVIGNSELLKKLRELGELERGDFLEAKETVKARNEMRKELRKMVDAKTQLPEMSELYVGLKRTDGRVAWKDLTEEIKARYKISESDYTHLLAEYRTPGRRLVYGAIKDSEDKIRQMEFEFVTPKSLAE